MTRNELVSLGCGKYCDQTAGWKRKQNLLYKVEGVWEHFKERREHYRSLFSGDAGAANKTAQAEVDELLFQRSEGKAPAPVEQEENDRLYDMTEFGEAANAKIDPIRDLHWVYQNIPFSRPDPKTAPSPGAFAHLVFIQRSEENLMDFYTKVYLRLIPAKSQIEDMSKKYDDNRPLNELLERLQRECRESKG